MDRDNVRSTWHDLTACFRALAEHPGPGTASDAIRPGLRRQQQGRHIVFFVTKPYGVRIVRVLHERMDHRHHQWNCGPPAPGQVQCPSAIGHYVDSACTMRYGSDAGVDAAAD